MGVGYTWWEEAGLINGTDEQELLYVSRHKNLYEKQRDAWEEAEMEEQ